MSSESVKEEPAFVDEARADLSDLYGGHVIKKQLVLGPVILQPPDFVYNLNGQKCMANVKQEQANRDKIVDTPVSVKQESKWEAEENMVQPKCETAMAASHGEPNNEAAGNMLASRGEPTVFDEAVKQELLKCEADDWKLNDKYQGLCLQGDPQEANSSHPKPDSTQGDGLITEKLQSRVKLQPRLSSRMRIQYETDTEFDNIQYETDKEFEKTSKKPKMFECNYCGKRFTLKQGLINHIRTHTGERPYKCKLCSKKFSDCAVLVRHRRMHEGQKPHTCEICGKKYSEKYLLKNHKLVHTGEMQYFCTLCPKSFVNSSNFRRHQRVHVHKYVCDVCKRNFADTDSLVSHIKYHMKPKPYACKLCGKRFGQTGHFNRHMATHTGPKKMHTCGLCSKGFTQKASLKKHVGRKVCEKKR